MVWALGEAGVQVPGARLAIASDVPDGAGLSSSAALECAVLAALVDLAGADLPTSRLAADRAAGGERVRRRADRHHGPVGVDAVPPGHALFLDCRSLDMEHIPFDIGAGGLAILVVDSRAPHQHADGEYADRRRTCEEAAAPSACRRCATSTSTTCRPRCPSWTTRSPASASGTWSPRTSGFSTRSPSCATATCARVGPLMTASHVSMRDDYEITVPEVDTAVEAALSAGAYGARMTGGGFGGCVLALIDTAAAASVEATIRDAFAARGFREPVAFVAHPAAGAARVDATPTKE